MSTETMKVDVLEVLDQAIQREKDAGQAFVAQVAARAAVGELIAADRKYDSARKSWEQCKKGGYARYLTASKRRAEALARIGGAA